MVYITGDMHGDEDRLYDKNMRKLKEGDILIICGDFGFIWSGDEKEKKLLDYLGQQQGGKGLSEGIHYLIKFFSAHVKGN